MFELMLINIKLPQQLPLLCEPLGSVVHSGTLAMMHVWMKSLVDGLSYYGELTNSLATVLSNPVNLLALIHMLN